MSLSRNSFILATIEVKSSFNLSNIISLLFGLLGLFFRNTP
jgi:hypothetical protein